MTINIEKAKEFLNNEVTKLEAELGTVGRKNPDNQTDWEATTREDGQPAEEGDVADEIEEYENNKGILNQLEIRLNKVKEALSKIEDGSYGKCTVCGEPIEEDRMEANPSAMTCKSHM